jgi:hypothetical protein
MPKNPNKKIPMLVVPDPFYSAFLNLLKLSLTELKILSHKIIFVNRVFHKLFRTDLL